MSIEEPILSSIPSRTCLICFFYWMLSFQFELVVPGSLAWRARNVFLGSILGAGIGFPLGKYLAKLTKSFSYISGKWNMITFCFLIFVFNSKKQRAFSKFTCSMIYFYPLDLFLLIEFVMFNDPYAWLIRITLLWLFPHHEQNLSTKIVL